VAYLALGELGVPDTKGNDEIGHLARTLNRMLDRIENTVHQLHTMTDSLAHDLRSPLTAIRGKSQLPRDRSTWRPPCHQLTE